MNLHDRILRARPVSPDAGMTLVELMVAMAVFSILMGIVGVALLPTFSGIRNINARTTSLNEGQSAMEWLSRQLRYTTVGVTGANPTLSKSIISYTASSIDFYTLSGAGTKNEVPYEVVAYIVSDGATATTQSLVTDTYTLTGTDGNYSRIAGGTPIQRKLLHVPKTVTPFAVSVHVTCTVAQGCGPSLVSGRTVTPNATSLTLYENEKFDYVAISIGDPADPKSVISQQIALVNT